MTLTPLADKIEAFGARVFDVDGHDVDALAAPTELPSDGRPIVVLAKTDPCHGLELLRSRSPKLHYLRFTSAAERESYAQAYQAMLARETP